VITIPGLPEASSARLLEVLRANPHVDSIWLYGSRAMGSYRPASDIDLTLGGDRLSHIDLLRLMARIDDLLLPWQVDLSLRQTLPEDLQAHVGRVGQCLWSRSAAAAVERSALDLPRLEGEMMISPDQLSNAGLFELIEP